MDNTTINIHFDDAEHQCESYISADKTEIVFTCSKCLNYERRFNIQTGKMTHKHTNTEIRHGGFYFPKSLSMGICSLN